MLAPTVGARTSQPWLMVAHTDSRLMKVDIGWELKTAHTDPKPSVAVRMDL